MPDSTPREPIRPFLWPDIVFDLHQLLAVEWADVYIVGGAVRDAFLHRPLKDLDLAIARESLALGRRIANHFNGDFFVLDAERHVARVLLHIDGTRFTIDVAQFRGLDLQSDLVDRDFTINAMAVDLTGDLRLLIDPLAGEQDAMDKVIRRCNEHSISSDPIRALRAVRQSVQLAAHIEKETVTDIRAVRLSTVSPERIRDELITLLSKPRCAAGLRVAFALGLLTQIFPELEILSMHELDGTGGRTQWQQIPDVIENLSQILLAISSQRTDHTAASFGLGMLVMQLDQYRVQLQELLAVTWPDERPYSAMLTLAVMLHAVAGLPGQNARRSVQHYASTLRLSNAEKQRLHKIVDHYAHLQSLEDVSPLSIYQYWNSLGAAGVDVGLVGLADYLSKYRFEFDQDSWLGLVEKVSGLFNAYFLHYVERVMPQPVLTGDDILERFHVKPGPIVGELLDRIRKAQITGEVTSSDDAIRIVENYLSEHESN